MSPSGGWYHSNACLSECAVNNADTTLAALCVGVTSSRVLDKCIVGTWCGAESTSDMSTAQMVAHRDGHPVASHPMPVQESCLTILLNHGAVVAVIVLSSTPVYCCTTVHCAVCCEQYSSHHTTRLAGEVFCQQLSTRIIASSYFALLLPVQSVVDTQRTAWIYAQCEWGCHWLKPCSDGRDAPSTSYLSCC